MAKTAERSAARLAAVQALYQMDVAGKGVSTPSPSSRRYWIGREVEGVELQAGRERLFPRYSVAAWCASSARSTARSTRRSPRAGR